MAEFRPTAAQSAAITARGSTVLVSAGAGSGKTKVLTERLMGCITDEQRPADLDSFLIITFTRAAAGELRGRIMDELAARLAREPGSRRLRRQSALCQRAQIGTIHSFCAALLRENSHLAQRSPDFKIADDDRAQAMKAAALERVLEARYAAGADNAEFLLLAAVIRVRGDAALPELLRHLAEAFLYMPCQQPHARKRRHAVRAGASVFEFHGDVLLVRAALPRLHKLRVVQHEAAAALRLAKLSGKLRVVHIALCGEHGVSRGNIHHPGGDRLMAV